MAIFKHCPTLIMLVFQLICMSILTRALPSNMTDNIASDVNFAELNTAEPRWTSVPHEFSVWLNENYTLEQHWQHIGKELPISHEIMRVNAYLIKFDNETTEHLLEHEEDILALIRSDPNVEVLQNQASRLDHDTEITRLSAEDQARLSLRSQHPSNSTSRYISVDYQKDTHWNLRQISAKNVPDKNQAYYYIFPAGTGVNVYVLDTGIHKTLVATHSDRFKYGPNFVASESGYDESGHGSHVAGIVGSEDYGVAKKCNIIAVKIADKTRAVDIQGLVRGLVWVLGDHETQKKSDPRWKGSIINASWQVQGLGSESAEKVREIIRYTHLAGIVLVAAAGNTGENPADANIFPALSDKSITVAASTEDYRHWYKSGWGPKVDIYAPGTGIISYWIGDGGELEAALSSGTSMSAPHAAGVVALFMSNEGTMNTPTARSRLWANANKGVISNVPDGTPNLLLNTGVLKINPYIDAPHDELRHE